MRGMSPAARRCARGSRGLLALVVLGAIVVWARCSYTPPVAPDEPNTRFLGCFAGAINDANLTGRITVVLEPPADTQDTLTLNGCIRTEIEPQPPAFATFAGSVQEVREEALVTTMPTGGAPQFTLRIVREPAGAVDATEIDVTNAGGAPFQLAADLPRCNPQVSCAALVVAMRPAPEPVLELP